ncbi:MAG: hypothetical protein F6K45_16760 [Kamptonema sp. SIO1D9]|nr:hypothetical protein [Kamptonema sp. SIO1D9]
MSLNQAESNLSNSASFRISPLICLTLLSLYIALTIPLPFLAKVVASPVPPALLWLGISIGLILLSGALSERVILTDDQIKVTYPRWFPKFFRQGWELNWSEIKDFKMRTTGQGGLVYYFTSKSQEKAYLLPMRVVGFARLVKLVEIKTGIDTSDIRPLSQPWMYLILLVFTIFLLFVDAWTIVNALTTNLIT